MKRILFLLLILLVNAVPGFCEEIQFTASAPKVVEVGEQFRLTFSINERGKNLQLPKLNNFTILMGPSTSSSMSTQIINGKMTTSSSYSHTYVLVAEKEGKHRISPAQITVKGEQIQSNSITIEVVKGNSKAKQNKQQRQRNSAAAQRITQENLFVKVDVNRRSVYMGEPIVATIKVYTRLSISGFGDSKFPSFQGFLSQEVPTTSQINLERENINGTIYNTGVIRKLLLFPQHTGEITIDPFELECIIRQRKGRQARSFFDDFFDAYQDVRVPRRSKPVKIRVKEFPANAPASFHGAVGDFKLKATMDKDSVKANDAITLKVMISGNGNLKLIDPLKLDIPADFEGYAPKTNQNLKSSPRGMIGSTSFEYLIIPRHGGEYTIDPAAFTFFDPRTRQYKTLKTPQFKIKVSKGSQQEASSVVSNFSREDVKFIGKDIRFIKTSDYTPRIKGEVFFGTLNFYLGYLIPLFLFMLIYLFNRKRIKENADVVRVKNKRANKMAMKRLKNAALSLKQNQREQFHDDILKALWGYTSDKLNLPLANLNKENIVDILSTKNVDQSLIDKFMEILNICEFARYSPSSDTSEMDNLYQETMDTITKLEKNI